MLHLGTVLQTGDSILGDCCRVPCLSPCCSSVGLKLMLCVDALGETVASGLTTAWAAAFIEATIKHSQRSPFVLCSQAVGYMCCSLTHVLLT